jgi:hypothetical protein
MTDREQIAQVCGWNRVLAGENCCLRARLQQVERQCSQTGVELAAAQVLFGKAIDAALEGAGS